MKTELQEYFLQLVRLGIGTDSNLNDNHNQNLFKGVDWTALKALADAQGLTAVVLDGLDRLSPASGSKFQDSSFKSQISNIPKMVRLEWIGEVLQGYEYRYELYRRAIAEMAAFYNEHGYKMMIIKGYACGIDWPKPEHRQYGDIDIWLFGQQVAADKELGSWFKDQGSKTEIDNSHHHHTVFYWRDFMVENHYDFNNVHHHKSGVALEKIFKVLSSASKLDDNENLEPGTKNLKHAPTAKGMRHGSVEVYGEKVYLPSPNLHSLFLLKHSMTDFAAFFVTLRQVLDWSFHVQRYHKEIDWDWLIKVLKEFHMYDFFNIINAICVDDLGFDSSIFPCVQVSPALKDKVLSDILAPKFTRESPEKLIPRLLYKYRRWKGNAWKHKMCYNESLWSAFWSGVWNHLLKPSSI